MRRNISTKNTQDLHLQLYDKASKQKFMPLLEHWLLTLFATTTTTTST